MTNEPDQIDLVAQAQKVCQIIEAEWTSDTMTVINCNKSALLESIESAPLDVLLQARRELDQIFGKATQTEANLREDLARTVKIREQTIAKLKLIETTMLIRSTPNE